MPFFINHALTTNKRLAGTWKSAVSEVYVFLPGRYCLIFGGHVELDWRFTFLGSSEYRRYPFYDTTQRRPLLLKTVGKPCMCTSQCCDCSPFRLICFLQFTMLLYTVPYLGSDACLHFANCTVQSRRTCRKYFPLRTTLLTSWLQERNPVAKAFGVFKSPFVMFTCYEVL
jgi:hypothetical protein